MGFNDNEKEYKLSKEKLAELVDTVLTNYGKRTSSQYEIINFKLDSIENQTTRTNGRLTELEKRVVDIEKDNIGRIMTCPQRHVIKELQENAISIKAMRKLMIQGITIAGIFFTILFGLLRVLLERSII